MSGAEAVQWLPAVAVLVAGIVGGIIVVFVSRSRRAELAREKEMESIDDLERQRDLLIVRLREMRDSSDLSDRRPLEEEAAGVLRRIEEMKHESATPRKKAKRQTEEEDEPQPERAKVGGFLWGAGVVGALALIVYFVSVSATERGEGGSLTGGVGMTSAPQQQPPQPQMSAEAASLEQWVSRNPDDLDARLELARVYLMQQEMMKVWDQSQYVLERQPGHPRAKGYQAVVRLAMGQTDVALRELQEAIAADPTLLDARIHLALAYLQLNRPQEAVQALEEAKNVHPGQAAMIDELLQEVRQQWPEVQG